MMSREQRLITKEHIATKAETNITNIRFVKVKTERIFIKIDIL